MINVSKLRALAETLSPLLEVAEAAEALNKADAEVKAARLNVTLANAQAKAAKDEADIAREEAKKLKVEIAEAKQAAEKFVADLITKSTKATKDTAEVLIADAEDRGRKIVDSAKTEYAKLQGEVAKINGVKIDLEKEVKALEGRLEIARGELRKILGG